jgi:hypothetical protein
MQSSVDWQSALDAKARMVDIPSAIEASSAARCEIDLSPGMTASPMRAAGPLIANNLDMATSGMLHNDAPCDYLERYIAQLVKH